MKEIVTQPMKGNLTKVHGIMEEWKPEPIVERKPQARWTREEFERMLQGPEGDRGTRRDHARAAREISTPP